MRVDDPSRAAAEQYRDGEPERQGGGRRFLQAAWPRSSRRSAPRVGTTGLQFSNPSGTTLRVLDDGAGGKVTVNSLSATSTVTSLTSGGAEVPLFLDGNTPYTGAITNLGNQSTGLAGRIGVNPALIADPTRLVVYQTSPLTDAGDATRPNFIVSQIDQRHC